MPPGQEIVSSIYGAWRVALMDSNAFSHFNQTIEGFWRSFFAMVLVVPIFAFHTAIGYSSRPIEEIQVHDMADVVAIQVLAMLLAWIAFPVAMIWVSRLLRVEHRYVPYIIALNWATVIAIAIMLITTLLHSVEVIPRGLAGSFLVFAIGYVFFYQFLVARGGLQTGTGTAIGVVAFDFALGQLINTAFGALL